MAKFDESKVINALHTDRAEIGKEYYFNNSLYELKNDVERDYSDGIGTLDNVIVGENPFEKKGGIYWEFIYPYEEKPKKRMTNCQLSEWLAKGNGVWKFTGCSTICSAMSYDEYSENEEVGEDKVIRRWNSDKWIEPIVDIYKRDC